MTDYIYITIDNHPAMEDQILHACETAPQAAAFIKSLDPSLIPYIDAEWMNTSIIDSIPLS